MLAGVYASLFFVQRPESVTWIWAPSGLALALLLNSRRRELAFILPVMVLAIFGAYQAAGRPLVMSLGISLNLSLFALLAAVLVRRYCTRLPEKLSGSPLAPASGPAESSLNLQSLKNFLVFMGIIICVYAFSALAGQLVSSGPDGFVFSSWLQWWAAAVLGSALVVPLATAWGIPSENLTHARFFEGLLLTVVLAGVAWLLFLSYQPVASGSVLPAYVIFPLLIWLAMRFNRRFVTLTLALVCLAAVLGGRYNLGQVADPLAPHNENVAALQLYLLLMTVTTLSLNAALIDHEASAQAVAKSEAEYRNFVENASFGIYHSNPEGGLLYANPSLAEMFGYGSAGELYKEVTSIPRQLYADPDMYARILDAALKHPGWIQAVNRFSRRDGSLMTGKMSMRRVEAESGETIYLEGYIEDITERLRVEEALRTSERVMKLFVENAPAAIAMFNREMRFMVASKRFQEDFSLGYLEITGLSFFEVFPNLPDSWKATQRSCLAGAIEKSEEDVFIHQDGRRDLVRWEMRPWYQDNGETGGLILFTEVITARKAAEQALKKSEALLNETQAISRIGGWDYDLGTEKVTWTQELRRIYDAAPDGDTTEKEQIFSAFPDEDRSALEEAFKLAVSDTRPFDLELRFRTAGNKHLWVRVRGTPVNDNGRVGRITGTIMDISERKRSEGALVRSEEQLRLAMDATRDGMWDWRVQTGAMHFSPSYLSMLNFSAEEFPKSLDDWLEYVHPDDRFRLRQTMDDCRRNTLPGFEMDFRIRVRMGGFKWILSRGKTVAWDAFGRPVRAVGTTVDITELKLVEEALRRANRKLERQAEVNDKMQALLIEQATHDALTGLYNRRYMDDALRRELLRAHREAYPVSVLMLDIDHFKNFNDAYGHDAGDQVLVALGNLLKINVRGSDVACRFGGEEFVVIMPKASAVDARNRAEHIREDFGSVLIGPGGLSATISIGLAVYPQHGMTVDELLRAADSAMYIAKNEGRNCVRVWV